MRKLLAIITLALLFPLEAAHAGEIRVLHIFCTHASPGTDCPKGATPIGSLVADAAGNLYGATNTGGSTACSGGCGTIFKLAPDRSFKVLYAFTGASDGRNPVGGLTFDGEGNLYGMAYGGVHNDGVIFKLASNGAQTVLYAFAGGNDGSSPTGELLRDTQGNLFGVTRNGGGQVFGLNAKGEIKVLHVFCNLCTSDGSIPNGDLVTDDAGDLFGTTQEGGAGGCIVSCGTVFEIKADGTEQVLHAFDYKDGSFPLAGLIRDQQGNLYGTTEYGGTLGIAFKLAPDGTETVLHAFTGDADGGNPQTRLTMDTSGNLYGSTTIGGSHASGTIFEIAPDGSFIVLQDLGASADYGSDLIADAQGDLFGSSPYPGIVFEFQP